MTHGHHHHAHSHAPLAAGAAFSLLRLSAGQRLAGGMLLVVALWGAVFWAIG